MNAYSISSVADMHRCVMLNQHTNIYLQRQAVSLERVLRPRSVLGGRIKEFTQASHAFLFFSGGYVSSGSALASPLGAPRRLLAWPLCVHRYDAMATRKHNRGTTLLVILQVWLLPCHGFTFAPHGLGSGSSSAGALSAGVAERQSSFSAMLQPCPPQAAATAVFRATSLSMSMSDTGGEPFDPNVDEVRFCVLSIVLCVKLAVAVHVQKVQFGERRTGDRIKLNAPTRTLRALWQNLCRLMEHQAVCVLLVVLRTSTSLPASKEDEDTRHHFSWYNPVRTGMSTAVYIMGYSQ